MLATSCNKDDDAPDYSQTIIGTWKFEPPKEVTVTGSNQEVVDQIKSDLSEDFSSGDSYTVTFKSDKTCTATALDNGKTYQLKGTYSLDGEILKMKLNGDSAYEIDAIGKMKEKNGSYYYVIDKDIMIDALNKQMNDSDFSAFEKLIIAATIESVKNSITSIEASSKMTKIN